MMYRLLRIVSNTQFITRKNLLHKKNHVIVCTTVPKYLTNSHIRHYCKKNEPDAKKSDIVDAKNLDCPWEDVDKKWADKLKKFTILGAVLAAAAAVGALVLYNQGNQQAATEQKKKRHFVRPKGDCRSPTYSREFPKHVPYLLIGGGTASFAAFRAIKSSDPQAKVLVLSNECNFPYMRPPLSKEMWLGDPKVSAHKLIFKQWNGTERSLFYEPKDFYIPVPDLNSQSNGGVAVARGWSVKRIDVVNKKVYLDDDTEIAYDKCLVATGATPKNLPIFENAKQIIKDKVTLFREIFDFQELTEIVEKANGIAIIGGGFLGSELACVLGKVARHSKNRAKIIQIYKEKGNMAHVLPEYLSQWTTDKIRQEGVNILSNTQVEDVSIDQKDVLTLHLNNGKKVEVNHIIVAVGVQPNTQLAETSDLEVDPDLGGFLVNTEMEARSNLYVAGDCSCFYDTKLGRRRVEHHDHAVVSGRLAGENMTGARKPYLHQSMFWSDLGQDVGYEAIGIIDSSLPTVGVFAKKADAEGEQKENVKKEKSDSKDQHDASDDEFNKGVIFYLKNETVVGIVLWNIFNRMSVARQVLKDQRKYDDLNEVAKLFNIHDTEVNLEAATAE